jgi:hypothetical protein
MPRFVRCTLCVQMHSGAAPMFPGFRSFLGSASNFNVMKRGTSIALMFSVNDDRRPTDCRSQRWLQAQGQLQACLT